MPIMQIFITQECTQEVRLSLFSSYTTAVNDALGSPPERVRIVMTPVPVAWVCVGGVVGEHIVLINIYLLPGRTREQKRHLIRALVEATTRHTGLPDSALRILIHDMPKTDVAFGAMSAEQLDEHSASLHDGLPP